MDKTQMGQVSFTVEKGVGTIEFYHPAHNSLPGRLLAQLAQTIREAGADESVHVVVLRSTGERTFCAGASFDELLAIESFAQGKEFFMGFARVINAMRQCPKLILGRVQGKAVGGGVGVAAATDYCFATRHAAVKLSELAVGIGPFVVGPAVARKVGQAAFGQMAIDATRWHDASWALEKGLFARLFDSIAEMDEAIEALAHTLAQSSVEAMVQLKKVLWEGTEHWDTLLEQRAEMSGRLVLTPPARRAIEAFKKK